MSDDFRIASKTVKKGGVRVVITRIYGRADVSTSEEIEKEVMRYHRRGYRHLIMDCSRLEYMNSMATGLMLRLMEEFGGENGSFQMAGVRKEVSEILDVLGLRSIFSITDDVKQALSTLA